MSVKTIILIIIAVIVFLKVSTWILKGIRKIKDKRWSRYLGQTEEKVYGVNLQKTGKSLAQETMAELRKR